MRDTKKTRSKKQRQKASLDYKDEEKDYKVLDSQAQSVVLAVY